MKANNRKTGRTQRRAESPWNMSYKDGEPTKVKRPLTKTEEFRRDARAAKKRRKLDRIMDIRSDEAALREIWD